MFRRKPLIKTFCVFLFFSFDVLLVLFICDTEASIYEQDKADIIQQHSSALNGQHLIFIPSKLHPYLNVTRKTSGHIVNVTGSSFDLLQLIAHRRNFTFEYYQDEGRLPQFLDDQQSTSKPGKLSFFLQKEVDVMIGAFGFTPQRNVLIDYPHPAALIPMALLIPKPMMNTRMNYVGAVWQPFQPQVWLYLIISILVGVASLYSIFLCLSSGIHRQLKSKNENKFEQALAVIFGNILLQGTLSNRALINYRQLVIRFFVGAWCLSCFVILTAYSSVLVSFLNAPDGSFIPIINSVNDLLNKTNIRVTVDKGLIADILFKEAAVGKKETGTHTISYLSKELERNPENRCPTTDQCVEQVRKGSSVYINTQDKILNSIGEDWISFGRCDFIVVKEKFLLTMLSAFLLKKNSPYTQEFTLELMELDAVGLLKWPQLIADPYHCLKKIERETKEKIGNGKQHKPLNLKGLSGAFLVLGVGYALAMAMFILELAHRYQKNHKDRAFKEIAEQNAMKLRLFAQIVDLAAFTFDINFKT